VGSSSKKKPTVNQSTSDRGPLVAIIRDVVGGEGLLAAAGPGFEKPVQFGFHQLKRLMAAQHQ